MAVSRKKKKSRYQSKPTEQEAAHREPLAKTRLGADELPRRSLEDCVAVAKQLHDAFAGAATPWDELADALGVGKTSNSTKYLFWAALAYGLINKEPNNSFSLAELGRKVVAPIYDDESSEGLLKAATTPTVLSRFYADYSGHPIPSDEIFGNILERKYGIPRDRHAEARDLIVANAEFVGILAHPDSEGRRHLRLGAAISKRGPSSPSEAGLTESAVTPGNDVVDSSDLDSTCFYITPIGEDGSEQRRHADMMLKHVVRPAAEEHNLRVVRADTIERSGIITKQILEYLVHSRICVADLSFGNPNAFYELGVRHLCMKPCPQLIRKGDKIPFDVSQGRTIIVDTTDPYSITDRLQSACRELAEHMKQALASDPGSDDDNPIRVYLPGITVKLPKRSDAS